jgi:cytochrome c oxidase assembly protein subunit 15
MAPTNKTKSTINEPNIIGGRWPHRVGVLLVITCFPLIWLGGMVTTTDAGMSVPDWPGTYGYNMFSYPASTWLFGPFDLMVEHGHRLLASTAGLIAIGLVFVSWRFESRRWVKWFSILLLVLVIAQGALGGMRVLFDARVLAKVHGCLAQAFFAITTAFCVVTSRWWLRVGAAEEPLAGRATKLMVLMAPLMLVVSFGQLVVGAFLRHIAIDSSPTFYRSLVVIHVTTAVLVVLGTVFQWLLSRRKQVRGSGTRGSINLLMLLVGVQFSLGLATWVVKFGWPGFMTDYAFAGAFVVGEKTYQQINLITAHVAVGSLILAFWTIHVLRCRRSHHSASRRTLEKVT